MSDRTLIVLSVVAIGLAFLNMALIDGRAASIAPATVVVGAAQ